MKKVRLHRPSMEKELAREASAKFCPGCKGNRIRMRKRLPDNGEKQVWTEIIWVCINRNCPLCLNCEGMGGWSSHFPEPEAVAERLKSGPRTK